jgi:hypothetical protein
VHKKRLRAFQFPQNTIAIAIDAPLTPTNPVVDFVKTGLTRETAIDILDGNIALSSYSTTPSKQHLSSAPLNHYNNKAKTAPPNPTNPTLPNLTAAAPPVGLGLALPVPLALPVGLGPLFVTVLLTLALVIVEFEKLAELNSAPEGVGVPLLLNTVTVAVLCVVETSVVVDSEEGDEEEDDEEEEPPEMKNWFEYWKSEPPSRVRLTP